MPKTEPTVFRGTMPKGTRAIAPSRLKAGQIGIVRIDSIDVDPDNVNTHPDRNIDDIAKSLETFGQVQGREVGLRADANTIVFGNGTYLAARKLGWSHIIAARTHLAGDEAKAFAIAENRTRETSEWDFQALAEQLKSFDGSNLLTSIGWADYELEPLLKSNWTPPPIEDFNPPQQQGPDADPHKGQARPVYLAKSHRKTFERALALLRDMSAGTELEDEGRCLQLICDDWIKSRKSGG